MRKYEIMFIVRPTVEEAAQKTLVDHMVNVLTERGAENVSVDAWGKRELAYEINDYKTGFYYVVTLDSNADANNEFDRLARISEDIIRHIVVAL